MRAAVYIRKSREDKSKPGYRLSLQRQLLPAHAQTQGWQVTVYDDGHASAARGKIEDLKERFRLETDIRENKVDIVLVIELSRLSRDDSLQDYVAWLTLCADRGVRLATPSRILDPAQHSDWMLLLMEGGFSSVEMKIIRSRMAEGRMQAFRKGKWLGGPVPAPYVYDKAARKPVIDPAELPKMKRLWRMAASCSVRTIADKLEMPVIAVRRAISDERLLFYQALRTDPETGEPIKCDWDPVMSAKEAERIINGRTGRTSRGGGRGKASTLLSGMQCLHCGYCGRTAHAWHNTHARKDNTHRHYYGCQTKNSRYTCPKSRLIAQDILDEKVVTNLFGLLGHLNDLRAYWLKENQQLDPTTELQRLAAEASTQKQKKRRLVEAIAEGVIQLADAKIQIARIDQAMAEIQAKQKNLLDNTQSHLDWRSLSISREEFQSLPLTYRRAFVKIIINDIRVYNSYVLISYRFPKDATGSRTTRIHLPQPDARSTSRNKLK